MYKERSRIHPQFIDSHHNQESAKENQNCCFSAAYPTAHETNKSGKSQKAASSGVVSGSALVA